MVDVLDIKVARDLWSMRLQVASIAMLIAAGVAVFVMSVSNYLGLIEAMQTHYRNERFADVFTTVSRAPLPIAEKLRKIDGVGAVEPRIAKPVRITRADTPMPISGRVISLPAAGQPSLNRLHLIEGRWPDPLHPDEVIVNAAYAEAREVRPGETIDVVLNGRLEAFRVVGSALSPEFVFATRSAVPLPDDRNHVIVWAGENAVAGAFDMKGAFNDVVMRLAPGAQVQQVLQEIDRLLAPYGNTGAYERSDQPSHRFLEDELAEQETMSVVMPTVFFAIAAFLLNIVIGRIVEAQRGQIASLKALGFANGAITVHYVKLVTAIALIGSVLGIALGYWFASAVIESYRAFFRFPTLAPKIEPWLLAFVTLASILTANLAAASVVRRLALLPPSEGMRPAIPTGVPLLSWMGSIGSRRMPLQYVMALRAIVGRPVRTLLTTVGIALAAPLVLFGLFWFDAINYMADVGFGRIERGDVFLTFSGPVPTDALRALYDAPGVLKAEPQRIVAVRLTAGHRSYRTVAIGIDQDCELKVSTDSRLRAIPIPADGIMISRQIATALHLERGDTAVMEALEGMRTTRSVTVSRISDDILGTSVTVERGALDRLMREGSMMNAASLKIDATLAERFWSQIAKMPKIEGSSAKALWLALFHETVGELVLTGALILSAFGMLIALGVVYNSARVSFQEHAWELASLRIVGLTRNEVSSVIMSEIVAQLVVAIPCGLFIGRYLIGMISAARANESFTIPAVIAPSSYLLTSILILGAGAASLYAIRRRIDGLDLVSVLKNQG